MSRGNRWLLAGAMALASAMPAWAQSTGSIAGRVIDRQTERPLVGVQVRVVGTTRGAQTDETGAYRILNVPAGTMSLAANRIGYAPQTRQVTLAAGGTANADFQMSVAVTTLDQVIVTATGREQTTREIGSSVGVLNTADVQMAPITDASQLLQGKVAGVVVTQSSGTAGGGSRVRIRGNNSMSLSNAPLIIIDGIRVENSESSLGFGVGGQAPSRLNDINPNDVETVEVLKGPAAAALYGTAAANGVIQVTTKKGKSGRAETRIWGESGRLTQAARFPDNVLVYGNTVTRNTAGNVVSAGEGLCDIVARAIGNAPATGQIGCTGVTESYRSNPLEDAATTPFRDGGRYALGGSLAGGADAATYYLSSTYQQEQGILPMNQQARLGVQANTTGRIGEKLTVGANVAYLNNRTDLANSDNALFGILGMGLYGYPDPETIDATQGFASDPGFFYGWITYQNYARLTGSVRADYRPLSWLTLNGNAGVDRYAREERNRIPRVSSYAAFGSVYTNGFIQNYTYDINDLTTNGSATALFDLRPDLVSTTAVGTQFIRENLHRVYAFGAGLTPGVEESLAGATSDYEAGETNTPNATLSAYVQQQFAWRDRVFLNAALRADKNTAFGQDIGWISYPSVSGSWVVSDESFFPRFDALNTLRLRAAYGQAGLRPGPTDALLAFTGQTTTFAKNDVAGVTFNTALGNANLKPERSSEWEFGFESQFLGNRLGAEVTYFNKVSRDALVNTPLAPSLGSGTTQYQNLGRVDNKGVEFRLNATPVRSNNFEWNASVNGSAIKNNLVSLGVYANGQPVAPIITGFISTQRHVEGYPLGGYFQAPITGYADANSDGLLSPSEVTVGTTPEYLGNPFPKRELSFSTDFRFRDWARISGLVDYKGGQKLLNFTKAFRCSSNDTFNCPELYDTSTPLDLQAAIVASSFSGSYAGFVEDASFAKLREIAVTLIVPARYASRLPVQGLSVTLAGRNLATWTKYSGLDPEVNFNGQTGFTTGDAATLPPNRLFQIRLDANF